MEHIVIYIASSWVWFSTSNLTSSELSKGLSFKPTTTTYNTMMKACGTDYYHAQALMDEMRTIGLYPNQISWSILADICGSSGNVKGALQILTNMRAGGMKPDVVAYTTAIKVCVESGNLELALSLFAEMKKYQIRPNFVTYNTILRARSRYGSVSEVQQCLAIYRDMRNAGYKSNDRFLEQLIEEWCEGVIQDSNAKQGEFSSHDKTDIGRPGSLLLEKVAEHLQKRTAETLAVDLQGLTKVEARIVLLAVLRMIKENYSSGHSVKEDMLIVVGGFKRPISGKIQIPLSKKHLLAQIRKIFQTLLLLQITSPRRRQYTTYLLPPHLH